MVKANAAERTVALEQLREILKPGDVVYTVLRHTSSSGMSSAIDLYHFESMEPSGRLNKHWLSWRVAKATGWAYSERYESLTVTGAGMDMGFHVVYELSHRLFGDGYALSHEWL